MKKYIVLLLILMLALGVAAACGGKDTPPGVSTPAAPAENAPATPQGNTPANPETNASVTQEEEADTGNNMETADLGDKLAAAYIDMLSGDSYYIKFRTELLVEGQKIAVVMETALSGDDLAVKSSMGGVDNLIIFKDGETNVVDHESRTIMVMGGGFSSMYDGTLPDSGYVFKGSGNAELYGVMHAYEDYATDRGDVRFFFDGGSLAGAEFSMEGLSLQVEFTEMSNKIPPGIFDIPDDYDISYIGI